MCEKEIPCYAGRWRDLALERAGHAAVEYKSGLLDLPEKVQALYKAPAGSVTLLTADALDIAEGVLTPSDAGNESIAATLPPDCVFSPQLEVPLR